MFAPRAPRSTGRPRPPRTVGSTSRPAAVGLIVLATMAVGLLGGCGADDTAHAAAGLHPVEAGVECARKGDVVLGRAPGQAQALVYGQGGKAVILGHMAGQVMCEQDAFGRVLAARGYRVLLANQNEADPLKDLADDAAWLRKNGSARLGLVGCSMGGTYLIADAASIRPKVLVALSPAAEYKGVSALKAASGVRAPTLIMAATGDGPNPAEARQIAGAMPAKPQMVITGGTAHGTAYYQDPTAAARVLTFLAQHI